MQQPQSVGNARWPAESEVPEKARYFAGRVPAPRAVPVSCSAGRPDFVTFGALLREVLAAMPPLPGVRPRG